MTNIISTKISVFRNLKDYKFMPKLEQGKIDEIEDKIDVALKDLTKINLENTNSPTINFLKQNRLLNSNARAVYLTKDNVAVNLFGDEHLCFVASSLGFDDKLNQKVMTIVSAAENKRSMADNDQYCYLMSDIKNLGSGMQVESLINLTALVEMGKIGQVCQNIKNLGYAIEKCAGTTYAVSTVCSLGLTATEVYQEFGRTLTKLAELEIETEKMLYSTNTEEITDKVYRALSLLNGAYMLSYDELKTNLDLLRVGANLGIVDIKEKQVNALQSLVDAKFDQFITKQEQLDLANKVKEILK